MQGQKQAWRVTGLWAKSLPSGEQVLSAKVPLAVIRDALAQAEAAGLHEVQVEVWQARDAGDRKPTHNLRFAEPFKPQQQAPRPSVEESYPF